MPAHPKRSPTSAGEGELKEERMPARKGSCGVAGTGRGVVPPSSPMVSSANNPNKAEIPDRHKDGTGNTVGTRRAPGWAWRWAWGGIGMGIRMGVRHQGWA